MKMLLKSNAGTAKSPLAPCSVAPQPYVQKTTLTAVAVAGIAVSSLLASSVPAAAAIVWDASPATTGSTILPGGGARFLNVSTSQNFAEQFLLPQDTTLTGIDIYTLQFAAPTVGQSVTVRLWSDNAGTPSTLLQNFTEVLAAVDTDGANTSLNPGVVRAFASFTTPFTIAANTRYWIGMSGTGASIGQLGLTGGTIPNGDGTLARFNGTTFLGFPGDTGDMAFRLQGTPIPTPALLPGLVGLGLAAWRKQRREALK
jgi:hypothetical protein